ncbi:formate dehydrogenase accessory protein FdhE [Shewanella sp. DNRA4]|uniref:formate dehydrogenase accessory protein FdhE n=1 Tax=Shewanella sp. DNRA4 TaxID=2723055 RepID=UPI00146E7B83|nr:formate dehydrogenase accessory protein FdhE [Shewanella sp. DNRA4]NMD53296.1 formate dehydrogenase accessory protein FdhE [Shewanella sp. DNRA4]
MKMASDIPLSFVDKSPFALKPLKAANPEKIYQHRARRLAQLAQDSPLADYLKLCQILVSTQQKLAATDMGTAPMIDAEVPYPLSLSQTQTAQDWLKALQALLTELVSQVPAHLVPVLQELQQQSPTQLLEWGTQLRQGEFSAVPAQFSLFIWAGLSLYWSHWAPMVIARMDTNRVKQSSLCPVCGSHPVASMIVDEPREGLRYLHCSLCESEWHYVRAHCTCCEQSREMSIWSFDDHKAAVRIESCEACKGYTKMLFIDHLPLLDAAADDIASMGLDAELNTKGYGATTVNPLLLAHEA